MWNTKEKLSMKKTSYYFHMDKTWWVLKKKFLKKKNHLKCSRKPQTRSILSHKNAQKSLERPLKKNVKLSWFKSMFSLF